MDLTLVVAAGKGGTGKTLIATSLAQALALGGEQKVTLIDCDVEEPNADLLLRPTIDATEPVHVLVPRVDPAVCTACGACARGCQFSAIALMRGKVMTFPDLCAGCGLCAYVCPRGAIEEIPRKVGQVTTGWAEVAGAGATERGDDGARLRFVQGRMEVGELRSPPVVKAARAQRQAGVTIIDAPPGTACPMQETVAEADYCLLVTEPTPFGLHDLAMAAETCRALGVPAGVVINRHGIASAADIEDLCAREDLEILWRLDHDRRIAEAYARGETLLAAGAPMAEELADLFGRVRARTSERGSKSTAVRPSAPAEIPRAKELVEMPRGDGTGPMGQGPGTGGGMRGGRRQMRGGGGGRGGGRGMGGGGGRGMGGGGGRGAGAGGGGGQGRGGGGGGRGRGGGFAAGPVGKCVCPSCGETAEHQRGVPCYEMKCPKCGATMTRERA